MHWNFRHLSRLVGSERVLLQTIGFSRGLQLGSSSGSPFCARVKHISQALVVGYFASGHCTSSSFWQALSGGGGIVPAQSAGSQ